MTLPLADHRRLHQFWHDPNPPAWVEALSQEWQSFHPGWHYHRFDVHEAIDFMRAEFAPDIHAAFCDIRLPSMVADVFRLALLLRQGGVYVDMATRCYAPLDDWLNLREGLVVLRRPHHIPLAASNGFIATAGPGHPFIAAAWEIVASRIVRREGVNVGHTTGPRVLRTLFERSPELFPRYVVEAESITSMLRIGSSSQHLPGTQHWSKRQLVEPLYAPGGIRELFDPPGSQPLPAS